MADATKGYRRFSSTNGYLSEQGADNELTREIARLGTIGAIYETEVLHLPKRAISDKCPVSMRMAKKRFNEFNINPELIINYS